MDAVDALISRASALKLTEPAPPDDVVERLLTAGARAPDHGKLRPWRFILVRGDARARLGDVMAQALVAREPDAPAPLVEKERAKPLRAPLIVTVAATVQPDHPKIPPVEQIASAVCAAQNIMIAAHALGWGCMWKTGAPAYDDGVKAALGLQPHDEIVGFLYLGTTAMAPPANQRRPDPADYVAEWSGPETAAD